MYGKAISDISIPQYTQRSGHGRVFHISKTLINPPEALTFICRISPLVHLNPPKVIPQVYPHILHLNPPKVSYARENIHYTSTLQRCLNKPSCQLPYHYSATLPLMSSQTEFIHSFAI